jgi:hypothetical protein
VFFVDWRCKSPKKKGGDERMERMLRKLYENLIESKLMAGFR